MDWKTLLLPHLSSPQMLKLLGFVRRRGTETTIYPQFDQLFNAFTLTPFDQVKVVILGQDPYHGEGQAHGLAFSVLDGVRLPPSLQNIFKEVAADLSLSPSASGDLTRWAKQGVFLLNSILSVEAQKPASHQNLGWEQFTDAAIALLNDNRENLVFILWGNYAKKKGAIINRQKHLVLESAHPSPLSAYNGFIGSKPFSKANEYLINNGITPIDWR